MFRMIDSLYSAIGKFWCKTMHPDPMWPVRGEYQCRVCQRRFPVAWEQPAVVLPQSSKLKTASATKTIATATVSQ